MPETPHSDQPDHGSPDLCSEGQIRGEPNRPRRANPAEKKAIAYRKDHRTATKCPHRERRSWPKKKALRNQTYRRQVARSLAPASGAVAPDIEDFSPLPPLRRTSKWSASHEAVLLGEWVDRRQNKRTWLIGRKLLANLHRDRHRKRLVPFLESLIQGRSELSRKLARSFALVLDPTPMSPRGRRGQPLARTAIDWYAWLGALDQLLEEQPEWERKLRAWIDQVDGEPDEGAARDLE